MVAIAPHTLPETTQERISSAAAVVVRRIDGQTAPVVITLRRPLADVAADWFKSNTCPVSRSVSPALK